MKPIPDKKLNHNWKVNLLFCHFNEVSMKYIHLPENLVANEGTISFQDHSIRFDVNLKEQ